MARGNPARKRPSIKAAAAADGWQATEDDWAYLNATASVRAWKLVALACGIHPRPHAADQLPPGVKSRYLRLRQTVRGSLSWKAGDGRLTCDPDGINAGSKADTKLVKLSDFVAFMEGIGEEVDQRMRRIATSAKAMFDASSSAASNRSLERSIELSHIRIDARMRTEDVTRRLKSISKLLLAVAVHNDSYKYDVSRLGHDGKALVGASSNVFAALSNAVAASGLGTMDGETVRYALWFVIDMCGRDEVMTKLLPKKA